MKKLIFALATAALLSIGAWAQTPSPAPVAPANAERHDSRTEHRRARRVHHRHMRHARHGHHRAA